MAHRQMQKAPHLATAMSAAVVKELLGHLQKGYPLATGTKAMLNKLHIPTLCLVMDIVLRRRILSEVLQLLTILEPLEDINHPLPAWIISQAATFQLHDAGSSTATHSPGTASGGSARGRSR